MKYLSYIPALNLVSPLETDGDWHSSAIDWPSVTFEDSDFSVFGEWGLYLGEVPSHGPMMVADHLRALLDMINNGYFGSAQGMRENIINNEIYSPVIFQMVWSLMGHPNWTQIDAFMGKEYLCDWLDFKEEVFKSAHT
jgi:hypothetical protein